MYLQYSPSHRPVIREDNIQDEMLGDDNDELRISRLEDEILDEGGDDSDGVVDEGGAFLDFTTVNKQKSKEVCTLKHH